MPSGRDRLTRPIAPSLLRRQEELLQDLSSDLSALARDLARTNANLDAAECQLERRREDLDRLIDRVRHCRCRVSVSDGGSSGSSDRPHHRRPRDRSRSRSRTRTDARGRDHRDEGSGSGGRTRNRHSPVMDHLSPVRGRPRRPPAVVDDPVLPPPPSLSSSSSSPPLPPPHRRARQPTPARAPRVSRVYISRSSTDDSGASDYHHPRVWIQHYLPSFLGAPGGRVHGRHHHQGRERRWTTVMTGSDRRY